MAIKYTIFHCIVFGKQDPLQCYLRTQGGAPNRQTPSEDNSRQALEQGMRAEQKKSPLLS